MSFPAAESCFSEMEEFLFHHVVSLLLQVSDLFRRRSSCPCSFHVLQRLTFVLFVSSLRGPLSCLSRHRCRLLASHLNSEIFSRVSHDVLSVQAAPFPFLLLMRELKAQASESDRLVCRHRLRPLLYNFGQVNWV